MRRNGWLLTGVAAATALAMGSPLVVHAQAGISAAQAETIAQQAVGSGAQAYHVSADHQGTTAVWDVHVHNAVGTAYDVKIGAASGAVISNRLAGDTHAGADHGSGTTSTTTTTSGGSGGGTTTTTARGGTGSDAKDRAEGSGSKVAKHKAPDGSEAAGTPKTLHTGLFLGTTVTLGVKLSQVPAALTQDAATGQAVLAARMGGPKPLKWVKLEQKKSGWLFTVKVSGGKDKIWLAAANGAVLRSKVQVSS